MMSTLVTCIEANVKTSAACPRKRIFEIHVGNATSFGGDGGGGGGGGGGVGGGSISGKGYLSMLLFPFVFSDGSCTLQVLWGILPKVECFKAARTKALKSKSLFLLWQDILFTCITTEHSYLRLSAVADYA